MQEGTFPKNIKLTGKAVGWRESDIQGWITKQVKAAERSRDGMCDNPDCVSCDPMTPPLT